MPEQTDWERKAANLLKTELKRQGVTRCRAGRENRRQGSESAQQAIAREVHRRVFAALP